MRLLDEIVEAHGGLAAWRGADRVRLRARSGGLLLRTRAPGDSFADARVEVGIGSVHASAAPFPGPGRRGVYADGAVRIETDTGEVVESRRNPRPCFFGRAGIRRNFRWDELDLVYFAGYAWWNYLNHPLLLTREDVAVVEAEPMRRDGQTWRRLDVTFPAGLDTHSAKQSFFYDRDLRLRRHDYVAEVVGRWARAAHMCGDHREVGGLLMPTRRRVYPVAPGGHPLPGPVLVALDISEIEVVPREPHRAPLA